MSFNQENRHHAVNSRTTISQMEATGHLPAGLRRTPLRDIGSPRPDLTPQPGVSGAQFGGTAIKELIG